MEVHNCTKQHPRPPKRRFSHQSRVALGLVGVGLIIFLLATLIGVVPMGHRADVKRREAICKTMALNFSLANSIDESEASRDLAVFVKQHSEIASAAIVKEHGDIIAATEQFNPKLGLSNSDQSKFTTPINTNGHAPMSLVVRFHTNAGLSTFGVLTSPLFKTALFLSAASFILYFVYLGKIFDHFDPSRVILDQMKSSVDEYEHGVVYVDQQHQIVVANRAFADMVGTNADDLVSMRLGDFDWDNRNFRTGEDDLPWGRAIHDCSPRIGENLTLQVDNKNVEQFKVNASPIFGVAGTATGAMVTFDVESTQDELE